MLLLSHPTGNQNVRAALRGLCAAGRLAGFRTTLAWPAEIDAGRWLPGRLARELDRRCFPEAPADRVRGFPLREAARLAAVRLGWRRLIRHEVGWASVDRVYAELDRRVAEELTRGCGGATGVYAYEDGALRTFGAAATQGLRRVYELPIGYWRYGRRIFAEEADREPAWASTLDGLTDSPEKLARKDEELAMAETVVVASPFTRATLELFPGRLADVRVIPYGAPRPGPPRQPPPAGSPLRALYVGGLSQRKGLSYLSAAMERVTGVRLTIVGPRPGRPSPALNRFLDQHHWIPPQPHEAVLRLMREHDVLVFPSLFEGFGLVLSEAMAQGTVPITTPNGAGPLLITSGENGILVPIRDPDAIAAALTQLNEDRDRLARMSAAAQATAARRSWAAYEEEIGRLALALPGSA